LGKDQNEFRRDISKWLQTKDITQSEKEFKDFKEKYTKSSNISKEKAEKINNYLDFYYGQKEKVAKCYTKRDFSAGACSTQRAESLNAIVKKFINMTRRSSFLKLVDCLEYINGKETYEEENMNRLSKTKSVQTEDPLILALAKNYSPYLVSKISDQLMK